MNSVPSVIFMNRVFPPGRGATGRVLRDLAKSFASQGWSVTIITTGPKSHKERQGAINIIRVKGPDKPQGALGYAWLWIKMFFAGLLQPAPHLLVTMSDPPFLVTVGQLLRRIKKCRHVNWCHDLYPDIFPALGVRIPGFLMKKFKGRTRKDMLRADEIVVIGRCMAQYLEQDGFKTAHVSMIPNWPDLELVKPLKAVNFNLASKNNLHAILTKSVRPFDSLRKHDLKFRVMYAGNLGLAHPLDTILGAAEILSTEHPEIEFVFVGDGPRYENIAKQRQERQLENIRLMPYQPVERLRDILESGDVHLISIKEAALGALVPCKLYAALAVERPCIFIGPHQSEAAQVITEFGAGAVVAQGAVEELVAAIKRYRLSSEDWHAAHQGASAASQAFMPDDSINAWLAKAWDVVEKDIRVIA